MTIICSKCGELKEHHAKGMCKRCYKKKHRLENLEREKARNEKWRKENPEKIKKYCLENKERIKARMRKYRKKYYFNNSEKLKAASKKWRLENKEKSKIRDKKYRLKNKEKIKKRKKRYLLENKEKTKAAKKKYRFENPGKIRELKLKRRGYGTVKKGAVDRLITENIFKYGIITCEKDKKPCPNNYHIDHIKPVSKGGSNDYNNLQILCEHCNHSKHIKIMDYRQDVENNQIFLKTL